MPDDSSSSSASDSSDNSSTNGGGGERTTFNRAQVEDLKLAEELCRLLRTNTEFAGALEDESEYGDAEITHLEGRCANAREATSQAVHADTDDDSEVIRGNDLDRDIIAAIQHIQAQAKRKYGRRAPEKLHDYFVGERLNQSDALLKQYTYGILQRLCPAGWVAAYVQAHAAGTALPPYGSVPDGSSSSSSGTIADPREDAPDILPGITIEKITALAELYALDAEFVPPTLGSDRALRDMLIREINDRRVELQWAADAAFPYTDPLNEDARRAFHLPLDRPFNG
jgi:hypothetical protein